MIVVPKRGGVLGFTNTRVMNKCLLAKWIFKIERGDDNICCNLLRKKYLGHKGFYSCRKSGGSQFWRGLQEVQECCQRGLVYIVGDGNKTRFWQDVWKGACPLKIAFPGLYEICNQQSWTVAEVLRDGEIQLTFHRNFGER
uniref:Uncharacterized protein n=1 Tax=Setaria viridis TaxID=4556 RepID=A0A4U6V0I3_SETVI|nr:hypothetical protein SEVIR_4G236000v2 [Setaria viridis]